MDLLYSHCASIDVHKKTAVVCCRTPGPNGAPLKQTRTFSAMTCDILKLSDWLSHMGITHVVMETATRSPERCGITSG